MGISIYLYAFVIHSLRRKSQKGGASGGSGGSRDGSKEGKKEKKRKELVSLAGKGKGHVRDGEVKDPINE